MLMAMSCEGQFGLQPSTTVSAFIGDDTNTSTLYTYNNTGNPEQMTYCSWVDTSLANTKFTNGWSFSWYGNGAGYQNVLNDLTVSYYNATVGPGEQGGAEIYLSFNPTAGDPLQGKTIHWIQVVDSFYGPNAGGVNGIHLDWPGSGSSPFYDVFGATLSRTTFMMLPDVPRAGRRGDTSLTLWLMSLFRYSWRPITSSEAPPTSQSMVASGGATNTTLMMCPNPLPSPCLPSAPLACWPTDGSAKMQRRRISQLTIWQNMSHP